MLHALATPVNAHTAALWGALKVCHVDNDTYCRCPRQDELLTRSASRWGLSMWILILKTHGGAGAGGQNGHSNHNHALFIERAHAAPRGESAVERETADLTPTNTFTCGGSERFARGWLVGEKDESWVLPWHTLRSRPVNPKPGCRASAPCSGP